MQILDKGSGCKTDYSKTNNMNAKNKRIFREYKTIKFSQSNLEKRYLRQRLCKRKFRATKQSIK